MDPELAPLEDPELAPLEDPALDEPVPADPVLVLVAVRAEPGSAAAMAPVASTPATPTLAVTTDSRLIPRRLSADGGNDRPPGSLDIGGSLPGNSVLAAPIPTMRQQAEGNLLHGSELLLKASRFADADVAPACGGEGLTGGGRGL
ncbi:MAG TPA: hypothetical protein VGI74_04760 [Streptosporangiaceae bacterium]